MPASYFHIQLQRGNHQPDDVIRFTKGNIAGDYHIRMKEGETRERHELLHTNANFVRWQFYYILYGISMDTDPFTHVQVSATGFPSVVYAISDLEVGSVTYNHLVGLFSMWMGNSWRNVRPIPSERSPQTTAAAPPPTPVSRRSPETPSGHRSVPPVEHVQPNYVWGGEVTPPAGASSESP